MRHTKKQDNVVHSEEKNKSVETIPCKVQMVGLAEQRL